MVHCFHVAQTILCGWNKSLQQLFIDCANQFIPEFHRSLYCALNHLFLNTVVSSFWMSFFKSYSWLFSPLQLSTDFDKGNQQCKRGTHRSDSLTNSIHTFAKRNSYPLRVIFRAIFTTNMHRMRKLFYQRVSKDPILSFQSASKWS